MPIDRPALAAFLRHRRAALRPDDVGLPPGLRRRTDGLRREEVAALSNMSPDYYARLERGDGPHPSEQMIAAIAQGLHLSLAERDHLFLLAGHRPPVAQPGGDHVAPGLLRIFDRLGDTPAEIVTELGETLRQTVPGAALTGDTTRYTGAARSLGYRWFTDPSTRRRYAEEEHEFLSRMFASGLREVIAVRGRASRAGRIADRLLEESDEFRRIWDRQEVGIAPRETKRLVHPELGRIEVECQTLIDPARSHYLLVYTAAAGSESAEKLRLLSLVGAGPD